MSDLLALSTQIIDEGASIFPVRVNQQLSEIADGVAVVESFSNVIAVKTDEGLVLSDTSGAQTGEAVVESLRGWSADPFHTVLYTHGPSITSAVPVHSWPMPSRWARLRRASSRTRTSRRASPATAPRPATTV